MSILKNLLQLKKKKINYFTTPSHGQKLPFKSKLGEKYYALDMSEVDGLDNLNTPAECIAQFEETLKDIYNSGYSHILTNGSTQGVLALMLATLNRGDKVLCASNVHKSVHNGLVLTGANPVWIYPSYNKEFGFYTTIKYQQIGSIFDENPDIKCLIITNPTYDGAITDISKIAEICKERNVVFIVDEAHGALWNFDRTIGTPAILAGADASIQSLHKTCGAINPAAIVHLSIKSKITKQQLLDALNLISTTSPSYALMCNIEETIKYLKSEKGKKRIERLVDKIILEIEKLEKLEFLKVYTQYNDLTRIAVHFTNIASDEAAEILYKKFKIECEIQHKYALTFVCGIGTSVQKIKRLTKALKYLNKISKKREKIEAETFDPIKKENKLSPYEAYTSKYEEVLPNDAIGKICAELITTYPPGIPILSYGELITDTHIKYLEPNRKIRIVK